MHTIAVALSVAAQINHLLQSSSFWGLGDFCCKIPLNDDKHKNAFRCTRGEGITRDMSARVTCICWA